MKIAFVTVFISTIACISCQPKENEEKSETLSVGNPVDSVQQIEQGRYEEVMAIHDAVMPAMSDIIALNRQLKAKIAEERDEEVKHEISSLATELDAANESMMDWMRHFNPNLEELSHQETLNYLDAEKKKIEQVQEKMENAQQRAENYLKEN